MAQYMSFKLTRSWPFLHSLSPFEGSDANCTIQRHHSSNSSLKLCLLLSFETPSIFSTSNSHLCGYPTSLKYMRERKFQIGMCTRWPSHSEALPEEKEKKKKKVQGLLSSIFPAGACLFHEADLKPITCRSPFTQINCLLDLLQHNSFQ